MSARRVILDALVLIALALAAYWWCLWGPLVPRAHASGADLALVERVNSGIGAPAWAVRACVRSLGSEHPGAGACGPCLVGRGHRRPGYVGRLQYAAAWNRSGRSNCSGPGLVGHESCSTCGHIAGDWRRCAECSVHRFLAGAKTYGRRWIRRHWGQTAGRLR